MVATEGGTQKPQGHGSRPPTPLASCTSPKWDGEQEGELTLGPGLGGKAAAVHRTLINKSVVRRIGGRGGKTDERERKVWEKEV